MSAFRQRTYELKAGAFTGLTYTLVLDQDLAANHLVMINSGGTNTFRPRSTLARYSGNPFGTLGTTTNSDEIQLTRKGTDADWRGSVTVLECISEPTTAGFTLKELVELNIPAVGSAGLQTTNHTLAVAHTAQTTLHGGVRGGGMSYDSAADSDHTYAYARLQLTGSDQLTATRRTLAAAITLDTTIQVIEWGSDWTAQQADIEALVTGGDGASTGHYTTAAISPVVRANTWVLGSVHTAAINPDENAMGVIVALGDGVNQDASETTVSAARGVAAVLNPAYVTITVLEHPLLAVDHRFTPLGGGVSTTLSLTVDAPIGPESYASTSPADITSGSRIAVTHASSDVASLYQSLQLHRSRHTASTNVDLTRRIVVAQDASIWLQSADFASVGARVGRIAASGVVVDAYCSGFEGAVSAVGLIVDVYERDTFDVRTVNDEVSDLLERIRNEEERVRVLFESGDVPDNEVRGFSASLSAFREEIKTWRRVIDGRDVLEALVYQGGADSIKLWKWERRLRSALVTVDRQLRTAQEVVRELLDNRPGRVYITRAGDTLQGLALRFFSSADEWRRITEANPGVTVGELTPGTVLNIPEGD